MLQDQDILDNISTGIVALDSELRVVALNAAGQVLLETSESRCLGTHAAQLLLDSTLVIDTITPLDTARLLKGDSLLQLGGGQQADTASQLAAAGLVVTCGCPRY